MDLWVRAILMAGILPDYLLSYTVTYVSVCRCGSGGRCSRVPDQFLWKELWCQTARWRCRAVNLQRSHSCNCPACSYRIHHIHHCPVNIRQSLKKHISVCQNNLFFFSLFFYRCTVDHIFTLYVIVQKFLLKHTKLYVAFIDFRKAFDSVNRNALRSVLRKNVVKGKLYKALKGIYDSVIAYVWDKCSYSIILTAQEVLNKVVCLVPWIFLFHQRISHRIVQDG